VVDARGCFAGATSVCCCGGGGGGAGARPFASVARSKKSATEERKGAGEVHGTAGKERRLVCFPGFFYVNNLCGA
jgi:hypothetical protein